MYGFIIKTYYLLVYLLSFFNKKAALWIKGRKQQILNKHYKCIWFHFASLGEFEQGRPVLERLRTAYPAKEIVITFFSPSGYEVRKNTPLANAVYYLPLDTPANARHFIATIDPDIAIFTKYEYWYNFFNQLHRRKIPLYVISSIFRPGQVFFKWYGSLHRKMLHMVTHFFVQDEASKNLLETTGITHVTVSGDTRFDRVWANAQQPRELPEIALFKNEQPLFIGGSTWPKDEALLAQLVDNYPGLKFIFAPHEVDEAKIAALISLLPQQRTVRYSQISTLSSPVSSKQILVIDNIGLLSALYRYADIAYIGGGFGAGIHNTLEAAAFGMPVIFGPNYQKFREARELIALEAGFSIAGLAELNDIAAALINNSAYRNTTAGKARNYVAAHTGATTAIVNYITGQQ